MSTKRIILNSAIGLIVLWGIWQLGEWLFSPQFMTIVASLIFLGYTIFILNSVGQTIINLIMGTAPSISLPKFPRRKQLFEQANDPLFDDALDTPHTARRSRIR